MGCGACGNKGGFHSAIAARNRLTSTIKLKRPRGYSGSGIVKSAKRIAMEAGTLTITPDEVDVVVPEAPAPEGAVEAPVAEAPVAEAPVVDESVVEETVEAPAEATE